MRFLYDSKHQLDTGFDAHPFFVTAGELQKIVGLLSIAVIVRSGCHGLNHYVLSIGRIEFPRTIATLQSVSPNLNTPE